MVKIYNSQPSHNEFSESSNTTCGVYPVQKLRLSIGIISKEISGF